MFAVNKSIIIIHFHKLLNLQGTNDIELVIAEFFFVVKMVLGNKSYTVGKPVYFPFEWCHICREPSFVG